MTIVKTTKEYFEDWHPYDLLIKHNYMRHDEIIDCLRKELASSIAQEGAILELGCGNAYVVAHALKGIGELDYTGIDLSNTALQDASKNLSLLNWQVNLIEEDILAGLELLEKDFGLVVAGFSLHHFSKAETLKILKKVRKRLPRGSRCMVYAIVTRIDETRKGYIDRLISGVRKREMNLNRYQQESIEYHIMNYDFPISQADWEVLGREAGFQTVDCLYRDPEEYYAFLQFT